MNRKEEILHQQIAIEWHNTHRLLPDFQRLICNYTNQANTRSGNKARSMGVKKGIPDWMYMRENGKICWIELKTEDGSLSPEQVKFRELCVLLNHEYHIIRDFKTFFTLFA